MEVSAVDSLNYNQQATTLNENSKLNSKLNSYTTNSISAANLDANQNAATYIPISRTLGTSSQTITITPSVRNAIWTSPDSNIEFTNLYDKKISEIKDYADEEVNRINDNIESVVKLMKNAKEDTQAFNNLLQSLIGRKQAMVDILKIIEKENNI